MGVNGDFSQSIAAVVQLIIFLTVAAITLSGWGILFYRLIGLRPSRSIDTRSIWLGLVVILCCSEFIHLLFPLDWKVSLGIMVAGCTTGVANALTVYKSSIRSMLQGLQRYHLVTAVAFFIVVIWCLSGLRAPTNFDSGLYHFGSIRWLNEYPIVPGLGNLHMRFAFNQSYFNFLALANTFPFWNQGYVAGGLFLLLLSTATLIETACREEQSWRWVVGAALFVYLASLAPGISSPNPDTAIALFEIAIFLFLFRARSFIGYCKSPSPLSSSETRLLSLQNSDYLLKDLISVLCISAAIVTIKLSSIAFAAGCSVVALFYLFRSTEIKAKILLKIFAFLTTFGLIHVLRGVLLSGAPFFPSPLAAIWSFDWSVFYGVANYESKLIYSWARAPGVLNPDQVLDNWAWFVPWFNRLPFYFTTSICMATGLALWAIAYMKTEAHKKDLFHLKPLTTLFVPIFLSFVFWFLTAPDPRFLGSVFILFIVTTSWIISQILGVSLRRYAVLTHTFAKKIVVVVAVCGIGLCALKIMGVQSLRLDGWAPIQVARVERMNTLSGLEVSVAIESGQCWNENLPCTPQFNENLKLKWFETPLLKQGAFFSRPYFSFK
jgi:hypothetical protein